MLLSTRYVCANIIYNVRAYILYILGVAHLVFYPLMR